MTKEFIPYKEALALKELQFNEKCLGYYDESQRFFLDPCSSHELFLGQVCMAPLYQQVFKWFREKHNLFVEFPAIHLNSGWGKYKGANHYIVITKTSKDIVIETIYDGSTDLEGFSTQKWLNNRKYKSYEEAELICLKKLITIIKNK